jgi:hypothetical protein
MSWVRHQTSLKQKRLMIPPPSLMPQPIITNSSSNNLTEVILIDLVNFQEYILDCINQLKLFNYKITVIVSDKLLSRFHNQVSGINLIPSSQLDDLHFSYNSKHDSTFRGGFWKLTSQRLFYLYSYIRKYNVTNCFHIENDIMLYDMIDVHDKSKIWLTMAAPGLCIPGLIFIPEYSILNSLIMNYKYDTDDMTNLTIFFHANRNICEPFPIINRNSIYNDTDIINVNFDKFNAIFDAAALGQYLGGVDPRNIDGDTRGFISTQCSVNYSNFQFNWKLNNIKGIYQPYIIIDGIAYPIKNLHVHCKRLASFNSNVPSETKLIPIQNTLSIVSTSNNDEIISGEKIQQIADVYLGLPHDFHYNPIIKNQLEKCLDISSITENYNNPKICFCYGGSLNILQEKIQYFQNPFILISHNSDENIDERFMSILNSDKVIKWFAQNLMTVHPKLHFLPIGIANSMWPHGDLSIINSLINHNQKTKDIYFYFNVSTNQNARLLCKNDLLRKGLKFGTQKDYKNYLDELATYKFAICPPGNGIDSHRIWECYYLNVIPVLLRNTFSEKLQSILPCILLSQWKDFEYTSILAQYESLLTKLNESRFKLNMSYYRELILSP